MARPERRQLQEETCIARRIGRGRRTGRRGLPIRETREYTGKLRLVSYSLQRSGDIRASDIVLGNNTASHVQVGNTKF